MRQNPQKVGVFGWETSRFYTYKGSFGDQLFKKIVFFSQIVGNFVKTFLFLKQYLSFFLIKKNVVYEWHIGKFWSKNFLKIRRVLGRHFQILRKINALLRRQNIILGCFRGCFTVFGWGWRELHSVPLIYVTVSAS